MIKLSCFGINIWQNHLTKVDQNSFVGSNYYNTLTFFFFFIFLAFFLVFLRDATAVATRRYPGGTLPVAHGPSRGALLVARSPGRGTLPAAPIS